jgi:hypothetical protein
MRCIPRRAEHLGTGDLLERREETLAGAWSSGFRTQSTGKPASGLRLWAARTTDFKPSRGRKTSSIVAFPVIDATLFARRQNGKQDVVMMVKDQTKEPAALQRAVDCRPTFGGAHGGRSQRSINEPWSEGPSIVQVGTAPSSFTITTANPTSAMRRLPRRTGNTGQTSPPRSVCLRYRSMGAFCASRAPRRSGCWHDTISPAECRKARSRLRALGLQL